MHAFAMLCRGAFPCRIPAQEHTLHCQYFVKTRMQCALFPCQGGQRSGIMGGKAKGPRLERKIEFRALSIYYTKCYLLPKFRPSLWTDICEYSLYLTKPGSGHLKPSATPATAATAATASPPASTTTTTAASATTAAATTATASSTSLHSSAAASFAGFGRLARCETFQWQQLHWGYVHFVAFFE